MKEVKQLKDKNLYLESQNILRIANKAVQQAKAENKAMGIPEVKMEKSFTYYPMEK